MTADAFLDTNILLRHFLEDIPDHAVRSRALIKQIESGELSVLITDTVIFETVFVLEKSYRTPREIIRAGLLEIIELPGIVLTGKRVMRDAVDLYALNRGLSFADCFHAMYALSQGVPRLLTFDRRMGTIPGIERIEP
jgi:predicted nucleic acid-binding protein